MSEAQKVLTKITILLKGLDDEPRMKVLASALVHELKTQFGKDALTKFARLSYNINKELMNGD